MIDGRRRLAGLRLADRNAAPGAEVDQLPLGVGIKHAAAADDERLLGLFQERRRFLDLARIGRDAAQAMHALVEEARRIVVGLGLHVLAEGERHRPAFGRIGQHRHRAVERRHDLLGPRDAVEIARHRTEAVIGAHRAVAEILDLLQHRIGPAVGEHVAGDQQHRQAIDMRDRGGGDHVGRAGADRGGAGHHPPAARGLGEGDRGMRHRLLVVGAIGRQRVARGVERLAHARDIAMAEDREHAVEQALLLARRSRLAGRSGSEPSPARRSSGSLSWRFPASINVRRLAAFQSPPSRRQPARRLAPEIAQARKRARPCGRPPRDRRCGRRTTRPPARRRSSARPRSP